MVPYFQCSSTRTRCFVEGRVRITTGWQAPLKEPAPVVVEPLTWLSATGRTSAPKGLPSSREQANVFDSLHVLPSNLSAPGGVKETKIDDQVDYHINWTWKKKSFVSSTSFELNLNQQRSPKPHSLEASKVAVKGNLFTCCTREWEGEVISIAFMFSFTVFILLSVTDAKRIMTLKGSMVSNKFSLMASLSFVLWNTWRQCLFKI